MVHTALCIPGGRCALSLVMDFAAATFAHEDEGTASQAPSAAERFFSWLDEAELGVVVRAADACDRAGARRVAAAATALGNGWLYPIASLLIFAAGIEQIGRFLVAALASFGLAFALYPGLKTSLRRQRPCDYEPSLARGRAALDTYSCPSGHAMTAAAYFVPVIGAVPAATPAAIAIVATIAWSRVALGHHYVSDVVLGILMGTAIALPVAAFIL